MDSLKSLLIVLACISFIGWNVTRIIIAYRAYNFCLDYFYTLGVIQDSKK